MTRLNLTERLGLIEADIKVFEGIDCNEQRQRLDKEWCGCLLAMERA